jgi:uncharacterized membrane protein YjfL (UPF0719 family)
MFTSLVRGLPRMLALLALGLFFIIISVPVARAINMAEIAPSIWYIGWAFLVALIVDVVRRIIMPRLDFQETAWVAIQSGNLAAGLVVLGISIFLGAFVIASAGLLSQ